MSGEDAATVTVRRVSVPAEISKRGCVRMLSSARVKRIAVNKISAPEMSKSEVSVLSSSWPTLLAADVASPLTVRVPAENDVDETSAGWRNSPEVSAIVSVPAILIEYEYAMCRHGCCLIPQMGTSTPKGET